MSVIQCYAPTNEADEQRKEFYDLWQSMLDQTRKNDIVVLMGNMNAKIRQGGNKGYELIMARHGI